jgi:hypothetical protein
MLRGAATLMRAGCPRTPDPALGVYGQEGMRAAVLVAADAGGRTGQGAGVDDRMTRRAPVS